MRSFPFISKLKDLSIILIFCVTVHPSDAQRNINPLLTHAQNNTSDTLIVKELSQKANEIKFKQPNDAIKLSREAIKISDSLNFTKGLIYNYQLLGVKNMT